LIDTTSIDSLRRWLRRPEWTSADTVPEGLSRVQQLIDQGRPFAILVTSSTTGDTEKSISATVDFIVKAHASGWICAPINLSYRPLRAEVLQSDLAVVVYKKLTDAEEEMVTMLKDLRTFVTQSLQVLDHRLAMMVGTKRTGRLDASGVFSNSFRSSNLTAYVLRRYLSCLHCKNYCLLELSTETGGVWSRASWEYRGVQPAILYGRWDRWRESSHFEFGDFPLM